MPRSKLDDWRRAVLTSAPALILLAVLASLDLVEPTAAVAVAVAVIGGVVFLGHGLRRGRDQAAQPLPAPPIAVSQDFLERLPDPVIVLNGAREIVAVNRLARDALGVGLLGRDLALSLRHPDVLAAVETVFSGLPSVTEEITLPLPVPRTFTLHAGILHAGAMGAGIAYADADAADALPLDAPSPDALALHAQPAGGDASAPRAVLVFRDETRAKRAEQSRADFVANASHELRSPLSALIGFIETLRGPASDDTLARDRFLGVMQGEAQRMARLVEDLMSLSRVEINEHIPPRHLVHLGDVLSAVAEALAGRAGERQMTIELTYPEDLPPVIGDTDQLTQVFHNLVDNAVKYAHAGTPIRILARLLGRLPGTQSAGVSVTVTDQGDGIEAIHLPRLTERFYRADEGRSRRLGGTGLGLAIVKHIVNRHRGRLVVESTVGEGSSFTVILPAATLPAAGAPPERAGRSDGETSPDAITVIKP